jgi:hypothetical protein
LPTVEVATLRHAAQVEIGSDRGQVERERGQEVGGPVGADEPDLELVGEPGRAVDREPLLVGLAGPVDAPSAGFLDESGPPQPEGAGGADRTGEHGERRRLVQRALGPAHRGDGLGQAVELGPGRGRHRASDREVVGPDPEAQLPLEHAVGTVLGRHEPGLEAERHEDLDAGHSSGPIRTRTGTAKR